MAWEYVLPAGLLPSGSEDPGLEERYEVQWRDEDEPPHYFFWAQVSALRLVRFMADAFRLLPDDVHVVLELRRRDPEEDDPDPSAPAQERWASHLVSREALLAVWEAHGLALVHDGTVGFGAYDPDSPLEVFLDDHKLVSLFAADLDPFEALLRRHGIPEGKRFPTILDADHDHVTLCDLPQKGRCRKRAWPRRRRTDVAWFAPAIRKTLRMHRQESPRDDDPDEDRGETSDETASDDAGE